MTQTIHLVDVFSAGPGGGNPAPIVLDADQMPDVERQAVAQRYGHESGFVLTAPAGSGCDFALRFWVPNHEMEMCGHATVGAVWLLQRAGRIPRGEAVIWTQSGHVTARVSGTSDIQVEISQPTGRIQALDTTADRAAILSALGISRDQLLPLPIQNASTSRVKTLIPLKSRAILDSLQPDFSQIEALCDRIGSTGLYPYAMSPGEPGVVYSRQFPKSSGYPEDAATGIAAAALAFGLLANGLVIRLDEPVFVRQGWAMGRPSEIVVRFRKDEAGHVAGCWIGGLVQLSGHSSGPQRRPAG